MKQHRLKKILKRYYEGTASRAERFIADSWYDSFHGSEQEDVPGLTDPRTEEETGQRIFTKIKTNVPQTPNYFKSGLKIAAGILLAAVLAFLFYPAQRPNPSLKPVLFLTRKGEIKKILLSDSTNVWLNANSSLEVLPGYNTAYRKVKLIGEAFFEVRHQRKRPFIIVSSELQTQVLGTSFNVSAYQKTEKIKITVNSGRVGVTKGKNLLGMLDPGKALQYNRHDLSVSLSSEDPELFNSWRNGRTFLNNVSFAELAETFDNIFNIRLSGPDKAIQQLRFRLTLNRNHSVEDNLKLISGIHQLKFRRTKNHGIELYK